MGLVVGVFFFLVVLVFCAFFFNVGESKFIFGE